MWAARVESEWVFLARFNWTRTGPEWLFQMTLGIHNWADIENHQFFRKTATNRVKSIPKDFDISLWARRKPEMQNPQEQNRTSRTRVPEIQKTRKLEIRKSRTPVTCHVQPGKKQRASEPLSQNQWSSEWVNQWPKEPLS